MQWHVSAAIKSIRLLGLLASSGVSFVKSAQTMKYIVINSDQVSCSSKFSSTPFPAGSVRKI